MNHRKLVAEVPVDFDRLRTEVIQRRADADALVSFAEAVRKQGDTTVYIDACCFASWVLSQMGRHVDARIMAYRGKSAALGQIDSVGYRCSRYLASTYAAEASHNRALRMLLEVEREAAGDDVAAEERIRTTVDIGCQYRMLGDWRQAYPILNEAIRNFRSRFEHSNWYATYHLIDSYLIDLASRSSFFMGDLQTGFEGCIRPSSLDTALLIRLAENALQRLQLELTRPIHGVSTREISALAHLQSRAFSILSGDRSQVSDHWKRIAAGAVSTDLLSTMIMVGCAAIQSVSELNLAAHQLGQISSMWGTAATEPAITITFLCRARIAGLQHSYVKAETFALEYLRRRRNFAVNNYNLPLPTRGSFSAVMYADSKVFEISRPRYMRKAMMIASESAIFGKIPSSHEIAQQVNVSERTLRGAFEFYEHMSLSEFLSGFRS